MYHKSEELVVEVYQIGTATVQKQNKTLHQVLLWDAIKIVGKEFINIKQLWDLLINEKWDITNMKLIQSCLFNTK